MAVMLMTFSKPRAPGLKRSVETSIEMIKHHSNKKQTSEFGLSYFRVLSVCLLIVCFVSAAGCHCFDFIILLFESPQNLD